MPYNLRKRKVLEPVEDKKPEIKEPVPKKKKTDSKKADLVKTESKKTESTKTDSKKSDLAKTDSKKPNLVKTVPKETDLVKAETKKTESKKTDSVKTDPKKNDIAKTNSVKTDIQKTDPEKTDSKKKKIEDNQLVFGSDSCGEFGLKKIGCSKKNPTPVPLGAAIKQVACGPMHTLSLTESGTIYSYGCNDEGALGRVTDGDEVLESTPTLIDIKAEVIKISTGDSHGAALTTKNEVFVWGNFRDEHGSVGLLPQCDGQASYTPIRVLPDKKLKDIASGSNHMLLLDVDGVVYSFGVGAQGQLGRLSSEQVGSSEKSVAINANNRDLFLTPMVVSMKNVDPEREFVCDAIYAGNFSSFATNTDKKKNRLAAWGLNNYQQLGYKGQKGELIQYYPRRSTFTCSTSMINVACGQHHTIFLTKTGRVYSCGRNEYGMLGIGKTMGDKKELCPAKRLDVIESSVSNICASINTSFAVTEEGKLYAWGMNGPNLGVDSGDDDLMEPTEVKKLAANKVISVSSGSSFTAVIVEY